MQVVAPQLKVEPEFSSPQSIKGPGATTKVTQGLPRMSKFRRLQAADRMNRLQLGIQIELVQLVHRLIGESDLLHPEKPSFPSRRSGERSYRIEGGAKERAGDLHKGFLFHGARCGNMFSGRGAGVNLNPRLHPLDARDQ